MIYAQSDHSFMCTFRRIAILLLPKLNATCAVYTSLPGFCCKTTQAFPVSSTGYPMGSVVVCKINDFGGLFKSFTLCVIIEYPSVAVNILPILLYSRIILSNELDRINFSDIVRANGTNYISIRFYSNNVDKSGYSIDFDHGKKEIRLYTINANGDIFLSKLI